MACSPAISLYAGRRASAIAGALFAFARAWRGRSDHARKKAGQTSQARRKRRPLRSRRARTGSREKRAAETAPARLQAARWSQNPTDAHRAAHRAAKRPKPGENTPQKKQASKRQIQSPHSVRPTQQQKPRRRIPQQNPPNLKAKLSASTRSTTSSFLATRILTRSSRASAGGSRTTPWRHSRWICSKAQRVRSEPERTQTPLLRARMAARTRRSRKAEETDSRDSKAPETAHRAPRGSAKKNPTCAAFPSAKCKNPKI